MTSGPAVRAMFRRVLRTVRAWPKVQQQATGGHYVRSVDEGIVAFASSEDDPRQLVRDFRADVSRGVAASWTDGDVSEALARWDARLQIAQHYGVAQERMMHVQPVVRPHTVPRMLGDADSDADSDSD